MRKGKVEPVEWHSRAGLRDTLLADSPVEGEEVQGSARQAARLGKSGDCVRRAQHRSCPPLGPGGKLGSDCARVRKRMLGGRWRTLCSLAFRWKPGRPQTNLRRGSIETHKKIDLLIKGLEVEVGATLSERTEVVRSIEYIMAKIAVTGITEDDAYFTTSRMPNF